MKKKTGILFAGGCLLFSTAFLININAQEAIAYGRCYEAGDCPSQCLQMKQDTLIESTDQTTIFQDQENECPYHEDCPNPGSCQNRLNQTNQMNGYHKGRMHHGQGERGSCHN